MHRSNLDWRQFYGSAKKSEKYTQSRGQNAVGSARKSLCRHKPRGCLAPLASASPVLSRGVATASFYLRVIYRRVLLISRIPALSPATRLCHILQHLAISCDWVRRHRSGCRHIGGARSVRLSVARDASVTRQTDAFLSQWPDKTRGTSKAASRHSSLIVLICTI